MNKKQLYGVVERIRESMGITELDYPIDAFELCDSIRSLKVARTDFKTQGLRGMLCVAKDKSENNVIIINNRKSQAEQNYHCIHEFMHLFADTPKPGAILRCYDKLKPNQDRYTEWVANEGAAEFLVPYKILLPMIRENYGSMIQGFGTYRFCQENAERFNVSPIVLEHRISNLKYEIHQYVYGTPLEKIEIISESEQINRNIKIKSLLQLEDERFLQRFNSNKNVSTF